MSFDDPDLGIRHAAFDSLRRLVDTHGDVLSAAILRQGFLHHGEPVHYLSFQRGIFRPRQMSGGPLSLASVVARRGRTQRYEDLLRDDGSFVYRFQGTDPNSRDNRLLRLAYDEQLPLLYFYGLKPAVYTPLFPVFVTAWSADTHSVELTVGSSWTHRSEPMLLADAPPASERRYAGVLAKRRLHQRAFRVQVLDAYAHRCAVCRLPRDRMLDAAHILPDRDERGVPEVPNGLALCGLHHRAFDVDLLGIRPDGVIRIARDLLDEHDGPTLEHGLKGFHDARLHGPTRRVNRPRPDYLEERWARFESREGAR